MIRFIWKNWWRKKEKFLLLIFGALIISAGLSYLIGLSQLNQTTIVDELKERWSASYDIVVRPEGSRSLTEEEDLLDPNYLSGLPGGISMDQYEEIKAIDGVDVAAPISMVGYLHYALTIEEFEFEEDGIYRLIKEEVSHNGIQEKSEVQETYFTHGNEDAIIDKLVETDGTYFITLPDSNGRYTIFRTALLAGIDPEQESDLIGLEEAIDPISEGRYFTEKDEGEVRSVDKSELEGFHTSIVPVIVSTQTYTDTNINYQLEKLDLPYNNVETANETLNMIENNGAENYLDSLDGELLQEFSYQDKDLHAMFVNSLSRVDMETGQPFSENKIAYPDIPVILKPSKLDYYAASSPFPDRWPNAFELKIYSSEEDIDGETITTEAFRDPEAYDTIKEQSPRVEPHWIGNYDPNKLEISRDPINNLPMETYSPAMANLVLDADLKAVNPPETLQPELDPFSYLGNPPTMLTTLEAAEKIIGEDPISAIRIKVANVDELTEEAQQKLEKIAGEIEEKTGLITDITLGSSPQPTLTHVPSINEEEEVGWIEQYWIKIGSSISIFTETKMGFSGIILSVIAVAIIYVFASTFVSVLSRRKEFAVLLAIGWRPNQLSKFIVLESLILGMFVAIISWITLGLVYINGNMDVSISRFLATGLIGILIYVLGAVLPAILVRKISPNEAIKTGEISIASKRILKTKGILSMSFNHFAGKWKRSLLSIVAIAMPTSLLTVFIYITFRLQGVMYTNWLGQYIALEVGPVHYIALLIALIIAVLTTAEITWQNISERSEEIVLLKAVGWRNNAIRMLVWSEGFFTGIIASIFAVGAGLFMIQLIYGEVPTQELAYILLTGLIPIVISIIGSIFPAEKAVKFVSK